MRATRLRATASFDCDGQDSTPDAVTRCTALSSPPIAPPCGRDVVRDDPVAALALELGLGVLDHLLGLGREADDELRPLRFQLRDRRQDVGILDQRQFRRSAAVLLELLLARLGDAPVRDRGGEDADVGTAARPRPPRSMSRALSTRTVFTPGGSGSVTGPDTSVTSAPAAAAGARDRVALLAGRAVRDVAHRIDRLVRRARRDDDALAGERLVSTAARAEQPSIAATISSGSAMRPMPASPLSAISPAFGPTVATPSAMSCAEIALRRRMRPHARVHRRREQDLPVGREQHRGREIVGVAVRHLGHQVGGRGRDDDEIGVAREADMADVELGCRIEQVGEGALARERADRQRRDELLRGAWSSRRAPRDRARAAGGSGRATCRPRCRPR